MDGLRHEVYTLSGIALITIPFIPYSPTSALSFLVGGSIGTLFLSPDIDLRKSRASYRWGALSFLWEPYRALHPHRGASHTYLYGPLSRLVYLGIIVLAVSLLMGRGNDLWYSLSLLVDQRGQEVLLPFLGGYLFSQWAHLIQDGILPWGRKGRKKRR